MKRRVTPTISAMNEKMPLQRDVHVISVVAQAVALQRDELDGQGQMEWIETEWMGDIAESLGATHCLAFFFFHIFIAKVFTGRH